MPLTAVEESIRNDSRQEVSPIERLDIIAKGTASVTIPSGERIGTKVVSHNLGYIPVILAFWNSSSDSASNYMHPLPRIHVVFELLATVLQISAITYKTFTITYQFPIVSGSDMTSNITYYLLKTPSYGD